MPRIELRDPFGTAFTIASSNPDTIAAWLLEYARLAVSADTSVYPWMLTVWPLPSVDRGPDGGVAFDWPVGGGQSAQGYWMHAEAMGRLAGWLEAEAGRGEFPPERESDE
jgi:hypothetical protein